ncbi:hypothetical protein K431DRAFT_295007 [Polychaeton citri CBS 116435]|uniref:Uncharacterized protein n=1 Tax=Polychaeton citri CBS 116435 TaxID=1314669 RepID=A0A9P4Q9T8_9PEZI|nr:hypothetical protein K431DRAFT_295007 [Polychaeton citri CBS 116435]
MTKPGPEQNQRLANAYLAQYPLTELVTYPVEWSIDEAKRNKAAERFVKLATDLSLAKSASDHQRRARLFSNMSIRTFCYFVVVGFASNMLLDYVGVRAAPRPPAADLINSSVEALFYKGLHIDNCTGQDFELYVLDENMSEESAFRMYMSAFKFCRNAGHNSGAFVSATSAVAIENDIKNLFPEAFNGQRDNQNLRLICLLYDSENTDVSNDTVTCGQPGTNLEFQTTAINCSTMYICVGNRADGDKGKSG